MNQHAVMQECTCGWVGISTPSGAETTFNDHDFMAVGKHQVKHSMTVYAPIAELNRLKDAL